MLRNKYDINPESNEKSNVSQEKQSNEEESLNYDSLDDVDNIQEYLTSESNTNDDISENFYEENHTENKISTKSDTKIEYSSSENTKLDKENHFNKVFLFE